VSESPAASLSPDEKHTKWKDVDPYPEIKPGLLNSAEIMDYVDAVGILYPFYRDNNDKFKPASYEIDLLGQVVRFEDGKKIEHTVERGDAFTLPSNSIAFVEVEPMFRLPEYIAARFNLRIQHVYRGLLLGTGPLIDPGFVGKIYIPLHNLTSREYHLRAGDGLIWVEFTKLAPRKPRPSEMLAPPRDGRFVPFPAQRTGRDLDWQLKRAAPDGVVESSIPQEITKATEAAESSRESAQSALRWNVIGFLGAAIAFLALLVNFTFFLWDVHESATADLSVAQERLAPLSEQREELTKTTKLLSDEYATILAKLDETNVRFERSLEQLHGRILAVEEQLKELKKDAGRSDASDKSTSSEGESERDDRAVSR